ncbi:Flp pilus assembly complex ATPase component TadA, partial [Candidatus Sumerlaeota bacterium]|nr:Flp pilus assembly complex ATPase component TadA [Candidatus Sumerlaeota bacterium]
TAQIAVQASLTGHLVFSTLHTNDAPTAVTRLVDMGIEPYLVASSLEAAVAQRLVRVLCPHCKQVDNSPKALSFRDEIGLSANQELFRAVGCQECRQTGYSGRRAVFELMDMDEDVRQLVLRTSSTGEIRKIAQQHGLRTLRQDGWRIVAEGETTIDEVLRVTKAGRDEGAVVANGR